MESESVSQAQDTRSLPMTLGDLPKLVDKRDVKQMLDSQRGSIDRLSTTNNEIANCNIMSQKKLATTTKLFKKTARQLADSKRDLDVIYKKISDLKNSLRNERPDLFGHEVIEIDTD